MHFCASAATKFVSHTQRHAGRQTFFKKYSNRVQDIPKCVNSSKSRKLKTFTIPIHFLLQNIEENKKLNKEKLVVTEILKACVTSLIRNESLVSSFI